MSCMHPAISQLETRLQIYFTLIPSLSLKELNFNTLLDDIPDGHNKYRMTANGRLVRRDEDINQSDEPVRAMRGWGGGRGRGRGQWQDQEGAGTTPTPQSTPAETSQHNL